jgi:hypothetical protein
MSEIVNLNKARKARDRAEAKARAAENRVRHGRTKAEKAVSELEAARLRRRHDETRRDDET